ncbi:hypothetical protein F5Y19DRAFT_322010 [Xylariaceae sp. FL1651]|nr:hypothetical protein F5Y19DRAFT_322010 [Xylariaceae sp. FL1651]
MTFHCGTCWREFLTLQARQQHMNALDHEIPEFECDTCSRFFRSRRAVEQHMNAMNHWYWECRYDDCVETWPDEKQRTDHEIEDHFYCADHDRVFTSHNSIKIHLNSRAHRQETMKCPFCKCTYVTAAGLSHHLERGSCANAPFLDRDEVYKLVRTKDPDGMISKILIEWHGSSPKYEATGSSWNGFGYECYFCHREFSRLKSLNQHLASPVHQQSLYHCPNLDHCAREFTSLGALMNHLESEICGYTRFETVQRSMRNIISGDKLIAFR